MTPWDWLLEGTVAIGDSQMLVREVVGNGFGLASAILGMRRVVAAWPVGIAGNLLLFTVFVSGILDKPQVHDLWGQASRQLFFLAVSAYGWWRWYRSQRTGAAADGRAIVPRWASWRERLTLATFGGLLFAVFVPVLGLLNSWSPVPDAWILTGSILATYAMARGWMEFWLVWIAVDVVGVPLAFAGGYYPSAVFYLGYGVFCVAGLIAWVRARRRLVPPDGETPQLTGVAR